MSDDDLAEVIQLPRGREFNRNRVEAELDELAVRTAPHTSRACRHRGSYINKADRRVYCRSCEQELDPYDVLDRIARDREHMVTTAQHLRFETDSLLKRVNELERLERNAKSRVKRARDWLKTHAGESWADLYSDDDLFRSDLELSGMPEDHRYRSPDEIAF